jgi:probable HAF family extracellular repeat protein
MSSVNRSDVIGQYIDAQGTFRNFLWRRGKFIPVETFPGSGNSSAEDINNRGQIAGLTFDFGLARGDIWDRGEVTVLPPLNLVERASVFTVVQINDRGVVVGTSEAELFRLRAVIWEEGQVVNLGVLPGFFLAAMPSITGGSQRDVSVKAIPLSRSSSAV